MCFSYSSTADTRSGGGALAPMLESLRRLRAAADTGRDLPKVNMGKSVDEFFAAIERDTDNGRTLNTWNGELYLEVCHAPCA